MTLLQLFYKFLKDNNLYHLYKKNMNIRLIQDGYTWYDINNINNVRAFILLSDAFSWRNTNEGYDFWNDINIKWETIIYEYYKAKGLTYYYDVLTHEKVISPNEFINLINKNKFFEF